MNIVDILLLSVALAMDCFAISIVSSMIIGRFRWPVALRMGFLFGLFQALMPLIGWYAIHHYAERIDEYGRYIAFGLLLLIGGKMVWEAFSPAKERSIRPEKIITQLLLAVATSIDALTVGISLAVTGTHTLSSLTLPLVSIGLASLLFTILGHYLGAVFGSAVRRHFNPYLLGGIILILLAIKVLLF